MDNPPLPQPCKEVLHPCTIESMHIIELLLVFPQSFPTYEQSAKYSTSVADTLKLYHHILGSRCPFDIWQQTWERHERREGG